MSTGNVLSILCLPSKCAAKQRRNTAQLAHLSDSPQAAGSETDAEGETK